MSTYCAPCLADLALVREAVTTVSGTAACVAHAVLLTHPTDNPQRRLTRLSDLRAMAEEKLPTASDEDRPKIELLVQEYALAGAMDMTVPLKELAGDRTPRPPKNRRDRDRNRGDRGPRGEGQGGGPREGQGGQGGGQGGGPRGDRPGGGQGGDRGPRPEAPDLSDAGGAPTPPPADSSGPDNSAPDSSAAPESSAPAETPAPGSTWDVSDAGGAPTPAAADNSPTDSSPASAPEQAGGE